MFFSKLWFFLIAVAGAIAVTIALVLPRPPARALVTEEHRRLIVACDVTGILLADDARKRVDLAGSFSRAEDIVKIFEEQGNNPPDEARMKSARAKADTVVKGIKGDRKPEFAMLIERRGRVLARIGIDDRLFGDLVVGRPLIDDALAGYLRDDLWIINGTLYFVSASPVVRNTEYLGAVVLGHKVTNDLAKRLVGSLSVDVGFFVGDSTTASSRTIALDQAALRTAVGKLTGADLTGDCRRSEPFQLRAGTEELTGLVARLPGEAAGKRAFYTVFIKRPLEIGFLSTLRAVAKDDLSFDRFPWIFVGGGLVLVLGIGITLMLLEADRPLRRLAAETVRLAKGDIEKLGEDAHPGKFGSIARSVNIHLDKVDREAKAAKKDMDQLLGPAPQGSLGTIDLLATALPSLRPGGAAPATPPPPSEFKFTDTGPRPAVQARPGTPPPAPAGRKTPPSMPGVAPPMPGLTPPPAAPVQPQVLSSSSGPTASGVPTPSAAPALTPPGGFAPGSPSGSISVPTPVASAAPMVDDDLLEEAPPEEPSVSRIDPYFKQVFDQFIAVKKSCNEPISGLTYDKFAEKLIRNRDELRNKTGCREVRFTVYVKDGKAALKATPVKDE